MIRLSKMKILKCINVFRALAVLLLFTINFSTLAQEEIGTVVDKIVAKVDDYIILKSDVEIAYLELLSRGESAGMETKCKLLEGLVLNKMMVAKAEIDSVVVEDEMVERELDMRMGTIIGQMGGDEKKIEEYYGKTIEEFQSELRDQVKEQLVVQTMQQTITEDISITPAEVKRFFKDIPADSLPYFSTEVTIGVIVKDPEISEKEKNRIETFLLSLRQRVLDGEDFQELARMYSRGPSGPRGGNLGMVKRGDMVPEFESAALILKDGEISLPVQTDFGFHIIQMVERRGNEYNARHILLPPKFAEEDFKAAGNFLDSLRNLVLEDSIAFDKLAKEFSDDKNTGSNGGYVRGSSGANSIPVSELDPGLFFTMDTMKIETISAPMKFTKPDGKEAMRIIYYKNKIKPHQANLDDDYQKIYLAAMNEKRSRIMSSWFRDAREDVYIEIDPEFSSCKILQP
jgi:peptidyl-prolyl cis-trans isomerase SurA